MTQEKIKSIRIEINQKFKRTLMNVHKIVFEFSGANPANYWRQFKQGV